MQPVLMLVVLVVAAAAMGVGFLSNTINLTVQQLGVGEENLESPISAATFDFLIDRVSDIDEDGDPILVNVIKACSFHSPDPILESSQLFCKLTDINGNVIAEGKLQSGTFAYNPSSTQLIPIDERFYPGGIPDNEVCQIVDESDGFPIPTICILAFPNANDVRNVHDAQIVAIGISPTENPFVFP